MVKIEGRNNKGKVRLFALSTCIWCQKTRNLLDENQVGYEYIYVDQLSDSERKTVLDEIQKLVSQVAFPTIDINGEVIQGFKEEEIRKALNL